MWLWNMYVSRLTDLIIIQAPAPTAASASAATTTTSKQMKFNINFLCVNGLLSYVLLTFFAGEICIGT